MQTILTTLTVVIALGYAITTTSLTTENTSTTEVCADPIGQMPPPPTN